MRLVGGMIQFGWFPTFPLLVSMAVNRYVTICGTAGGSI